MAHVNPLPLFLVNYGTPEGVTRDHGLPPSSVVTRPSTYTAHPPVFEIIAVWVIPMGSGMLVDKLEWCESLVVRVDCRTTDDYLSEGVATAVIL